MSQAKRNECISLVRPGNRKVNVVRYSEGQSESEEHIKVKRDICTQLLLDQKQFITEAIFEKDGLRADILVLDSFKVIEIANTETEESLNRKYQKYKKIGLTMEVIRV